MADDSLLPSGLCVVATQKPRALSLTLMVTSVVTVLNQIICSPNMGSLTVGSVDRIYALERSLVYDDS